MCVHSQAQEIDAIHPPCTARWNPRGRSPIDRVQVERPRSPGGASPVFGPSRRLPVTAMSGRRVLRSRPHAARRRVGRGVLRGDAHGRVHVAGDPGGEGRSTACSTASARRCRRWRSPARRRGWPRADSRAAMVAAGEAAADGLAAMVQPFAGRLFAEHRAAGRPDRAGHDDAVRPRAAARRTPRPRRRRRHPLRRRRRRHASTARCTARSCGPPASSPPCGRGPTSTTSTWRRAMPTRTASTTRRCCRRSGTPIVVNPDPRMVRPGAACGGGRSSTSTCRRAS